MTTNQSFDETRVYEEKDQLNSIDLEIIPDKTKKATLRKRDVEKLLRKRSPERLRPEGRKKWKSMFLAIALLCCSIVFFLVGWHRWYKETLYDVCP